MKIYTNAIEEQTSKEAVGRTEILYYVKYKECEFYANDTLHMF